MESADDVADTEGEPSTSGNRKIDDCELIENIQVNTKCSIIIIYTHPKTGTPPPTKKSKKSKTEKAMEKQLETFLGYQREAEERFDKREEERWERERKLAETRRKEEQTHQLNMIQMLGQLIRQPGPSQYYPPSSQPFNPDSQYDY